MGKWSLMGGFVQEDESVDAAAKRVVAELTGVENVYMEQVGTCLLYTSYRPAWCLRLWFLCMYAEHSS